MLAKAARSPITAGGETVTENDIVALTGPSLYVVHPIPGFSKFIGWNGLADLLQTLWTGGSATPPATGPAAPSTATAADAAATQTYMGVGAHVIPQL